MVGVALMLADRLYRTSEHRTPRFWAGVTGLPVAQTILMGTKFDANLDLKLLVDDKLELFKKLDSFFDRHDEFVISSV